MVRFLLIVVSIGILGFFVGNAYFSKKSTPNMLVADQSKLIEPEFVQGYTNRDEFSVVQGVRVFRHEGRELVALTSGYRTSMMIFDTELNLVHNWIVQMPGDTSPQLIADVAMGVDGYLYMTPYRGHGLFVYSVEGTFIKEIGRLGKNNGEFTHPIGIDIDTNGDIYVADYGNNRIQVLNAQGEFLRSWGSPSGAGSQLQGEFNEAYEITLYKDRAYVTDRSNGRIQVFTKLGKFLFEFGTNLVSEENPEAENFHFPQHTAFDSKGRLYVVNTRSRNIQIFTEDGQFLHKIKSTSLQVPKGISISSDDSLFVSDLEFKIDGVESEGDKPYIRKIRAIDLSLKRS